MDLNQTAFNSVNMIDKRLQELQREVEEIGLEYGFGEYGDAELSGVSHQEEPIQDPTVEKAKTSSRNQATNRYENLVSIDPKVEKIVKTKTFSKTKPGISQTWLKTQNSNKPVIEEAYETEKFEPQFEDMKKFKCSPSIVLDHDVMKQFLDEEREQFYETQGIF